MSDSHTGSGSSIETIQEVEQNTQLLEWIGFTQAQANTIILEGFNCFEVSWHAMPVMSPNLPHLSRRGLLLRERSTWAENQENQGPLTVNKGFQKDKQQTNHR